MVPSDYRPDSDSIRHSAEYRSALDFLFERIDYERVPKMPYTNRDLHLGRIRQLLALLGDPHLQTKIIHIAGTKGKGSTTALLGAIFGEAGLRCGSYTSPHLHFIEERFCLNNVPCSPATLIELLTPVREAARRMDSDDPLGSPTYFEIATAIAFLFFVQQQVDIAVLEVGLGGRLDSTNVCQPLVSLITSISFDHTKQLGNTLAKIAGEKAGIIKPRIPVVSGATHPEARAVIENVAREQGSPLWQLGVDFDVADYRPPSGGQVHGSCQFRADASIELPALEKVSLGLPGEHQAANAAVALAALMRLPSELRPDATAIHAGLANARCPARIEVVLEDPKTIVDSAHNVASVSALVAYLKDAYPDRRRTLLLATTKGKDVKGMLAVLLPAFAQVICTRYENNPRGNEAEQLCELATTTADAMQLPVANSITYRATPAEAWQATLQSCEPDDLICVTGSFFIAAEIRELLRE